MRKLLLRLLAVNGSNLRTASLALGRNAAYLHQFINRGTPKVVAEDDREILAEHLDCRPEFLKHDRSVRHKVRPKRSPLSGPYSAPKGYTVVPEADVRRTAGEGAWNGGLEQAKEA